MLAYHRQTHYKMKRLFYSLSPLVFLTLMACNSSVSGKIENRDGYCKAKNNSKNIYLVNTSKNKPFSYTVRKTTIIGDSITGYQTFAIELLPGDEINLGCSEEVVTNRYKEIPLVVKVDKVFYLMPYPNSTKRKYYCFKDSSLLKYDFSYSFTDGTEIFSKIEMNKYAIEEVHKSILEIFTRENFYLALKEIDITIENEETLHKNELFAKLKVRDPSLKLPDLVIHYQYEVTGEFQLKNISTTKE